MGISAWITLLHNVSIQFGVTRYWTDKSKRDRETWLSLLLCCIQIGIDLQHVLQGIWNSGLSFSLSDRETFRQQRRKAFCFITDSQVVLRFCCLPPMNAEQNIHDQTAEITRERHQFHQCGSITMNHRCGNHRWQKMTSVIAGHLFELYTTSHQNEWGI